MKSNNKHDRQLKYKLDKTNLTATVGKADRLIINCIIPEEITVDNQKYRIINIANYAFNGCRWLKKISLPNSLKRIGDYAFRECLSLKSISLPESISHVGNHAFEKCYSLKKITFPSEDSEEYDIKVMYAPEHRTEISDIKNIVIVNNQGRGI